MNILTKGAIKNLIIGSIFALVAVFSPLALSSTANAACDETNLNVGSGVECAKGDDVPTTLFGQGSIFTTIVNVLLFIIGAISVIMLIIGGIRYTTSAGDSGNVTAAKNTIMYALIGLIVAFLAFAVVNWVLSAITPA
jgi:multisubunit Na+/H+ antiporter MnhB subunit